jgi:rRNA maturation protein Rpf1
MQLLSTHLRLRPPPLTAPSLRRMRACAGPTAYFGLMNCVARHDIKDTALGTVSEAYPHLIMEGFSSALGTRVNNILKHLFPVPKDDRRAQHASQVDAPCRGRQLTQAWHAARAASAW